MKTILTCVILLSLLALAALYGSSAMGYDLKASIDAVEYPIGR